MGLLQLTPLLATPPEPPTVPLASGRAAPTGVPGSLLPMARQECETNHPMARPE